jgi:hypothetical protein
MEVYLLLPDNIYVDIYNHLIRENQLVEEAAFIFATVEVNENKIVFNYKDKYFLSPSDFRIQTDYHIELEDHIRSQIIKKAHDLNCTIIEAHSHINQEEASFSYSDFIGFSEFVPHVIWRLRGKPYLALVFTSTSFDGLIWQKDKNKPIELDYILLSNKKLKSSQKSLDYLYRYNE